MYDPCRRIGPVQPCSMKPLAMPGLLASYAIYDTVALRKVVSAHVSIFKVQLVVVMLVTSALMRQPFTCPMEKPLIHTITVDGAANVLLNYIGLELCSGSD